MDKRFMLYFFLLVAFLLTGCVRDNVLQEPASVNESPVLTADELRFLSAIGRETKFGDEDIDRIIGDAIDFMDARTPTRSGGKRIVAEIRPLMVTIPATLTRSLEETDGDLFYIVNFENEEGYSIISADSRIQDEIIVFVGHGNLPDSITNPGLEIMMSRLDGYAANSIAKYDAWCDSVEVVLLTKFGAESVEEVLALTGTGQMITRSVDPLPEMRIFRSDWMESARVSPMIPVEWGQQGVFNDTAEAMTGIFDVPAGCVAIATVQLMAYWQRPQSYHQYTNIDWGELCKYTGSAGNRPDGYKTWTGKMSNAPSSIRRMCADIIWHIGDDVGMKYYAGGSVASSSDAINLLYELGFNVSLRQDYSKSPVISSLSDQRPVYIRGDAFKIITDSVTYEEGHAWLIDGYLQYEQLITVSERTAGGGWKIVSITSAFREYFHNNFGWNGNDSGYYVEGLFDANNDPDLPSNTRSIEGESKNYRYRLLMWPDIHSSN